MMLALAEAIAAELDDGWQVRADGHDQADRFELHAPTGERIRVVSKGSRLAATGSMLRSAAGIRHSSA